MSHWEKYHKRWNEIQPPLRPDADVVMHVQSIIGKPQGSVLLLGVTPELADAFPRVHAVDKNPGMLANVWPGDCPGKKAEVGDWLELSPRATPYDGVLGDGSLNCMPDLAHLHALFVKLHDVMAPGAAFACRLFERPETPFTKAHLLKFAGGPAPINFHAFKWQLAMHIAAETSASVPVALILDAFDNLFPDREKLAAATGWLPSAISTIDVYRGSPIIYTFPSRAEFTDALPQGLKDVLFAPCGSYDMAECCPILSFRKG
jgi:hypothetical protein